MKHIINNRKLIKNTILFTVVVIVLVMFTTINTSSLKHNDDRNNLGTFRVKDDNKINSNSNDSNYNIGTFRVKKDHNNDNNYNGTFRVKKDTNTNNNNTGTFVRKDINENDNTSTFKVNTDKKPKTNFNYYNLNKNSFNNPFETNKENTDTKKLGSGTFGIAYLISYKNNNNNNNNNKENKPYVVKKINTEDKEERDTAQKEIDLMNKLKQCDIVQIYDSHIDNNNNYYIKQEYCDGGDMQDIISNKQQNKDKDINILDNQLELIKWMKILANQLKCIHENNVIHSDIKADNIFICNNKPKLADFGISLVENFSFKKKRKKLFFKKTVLKLDKKDNFLDNAEEIKQRHEYHNDMATENFSKGIDVYALHLIAVDVLKKGLYNQEELDSLVNSGPKITFKDDVPNSKLWYKLNKKVLLKKSKNIISIEQYLTELNTIESAIINNNNNNNKEKEGKKKSSILERGKDKFKKVLNKIS